MDGDRDRWEFEKEKEEWFRNQHDRNYHHNQSGSEPDWNYMRTSSEEQQHYEWSDYIVASMKLMVITLGFNQVIKDTFID